MRILILGGTVFLGRHLVEAGLSRGHQITLFNRGKTNPGLFPQVETIIGDREHDLGRLAGRSWDAVIDTCAYVPRIAGLSASALSDSVDHYTFISSISVYEDIGRESLSEDDAVGKLDDESIETVDGQTYGPLKALCEQSVEKALPGRTLNIRPGLIVGPFDPSDRFTYWPARIAAGRKFIAPESAGYRTQFIDVRDLAEWTIKAIEAGITGTYNATGPASPIELGELFDICKEVSGSEADAVWINEKEIEEAALRPFMDLPLWVSSNARGMMNVDCSLAIATSLQFRPIRETVRDTLEWNEARMPIELKAGLKPEVEDELLERFG